VQASISAADMAEPRTLDTDVVVVGGGPAGSSAATRAARGGARVVVVESDAFPRFHIGESMLPLSHRAFEQLGVADKLRAAGFVVKWGAQLRTPDGSHTVLFDFAAGNHVDPAWTWQVHRAELDALLLDHARACGAELLRARARSYALDPDGVTVDVLAGDEVVRVRARVLIDASGRTGFVARKENVRVIDEELRKAAVYAHFTGVPCDPDRRGGDTKVVSLPHLGWFWFIPLRENVMSVGAVLDVADYQARASRDPATIFAETVARAPYAAELLANATRVSEFAVESGFSYRASRYCGERWFLAGDAGSFLDPVFSTGVLMALRSGIEAADAAVATLRRGPRGAERVRRRYDRTLKRRYWFVRRVVTGFYDPDTRDIFFAPRKGFGIVRAMTTVLAGGFDPGWLDRHRLRLFFLLGRLQRRFDLAPRLRHAGATAEVS
jgi:flavin-dependent dehydrogenase